MQMQSANAVFLYPVTLASNRNFCFKILEEWEARSVTLLDANNLRDKHGEIKGVISLIGIAGRVIIKEKSHDSHLILVKENRVVAILTAESKTGVFKIHSLVFSPGYLLEQAPLLKQALPLIEKFALSKGCLAMQVQAPALSIPIFVENGFSNPEEIKDAMDLTLLKKAVTEEASSTAGFPFVEENLYFREFTGLGRAS